MISIAMLKTLYNNQANTTRKLMALAILHENPNSRVMEIAHLFGTEVKYQTVANLMEKLKDDCLVASKSVTTDERINSRVYNLSGKGEMMIRAMGGKS